ncbi:CPBP family intramembrane glutamic endopeptidase [Leptolyngbya sp. FACHB-711]|uniref:CPBP family intramembrane glutamic endopeptidase n=1 Tax=unclassified Leptolyngbya TaxID=2650499 RepID=UPI0032208696
MSEPPSNPTPQPDVEPLSRVQVLTAMGVTAIVLLLASRLWLLLDPVALLPLDWSIQSALWGVGLGVGITAASSITYRLWAGYRQSADYYLALIIQPLALPDLIWLGLLPALSEELLFRGVMLPSVGLNWYGLLISSLCFGVMHFSGREQWSYMIWATTIGLVLGWGALETGNLLVPVVAHIVTNLVSSCIWKWRMRDVAG